jgi:hypothetical protein
VGVLEPEAVSDAGVDDEASVRDVARLRLPSDSTFEALLKAGKERLANFCQVRVRRLLQPCAQKLLLTDVRRQDALA